MNPRDFNNKLFYRRVFIITIFKYLFFGLILLRLVIMQIFQKNKYRIMSDGNRYKILQIIPVRGTILDCFNNPLTENREYRSLAIKNVHNKNNNKMLEMVAKLLDNEPSIIDIFVTNIIKKIDPKNSKNYIVIKPVMSYSEIKKISFNLFQLPNIQIIKNLARHYKLGKDSFHILGYVSKLSHNEIQKESIEREIDKKIFYDPNYKTGKYGIEKIKNKELFGEIGISLSEVDARGKEINFRIAENGKSGENIKLTISSELQKYTAGLLEEQTGVITVMDLSNGAILSMYSSPSNDPNFLTTGDGYNSFTFSGGDKSLINKNISNPYPPGSIFKPLTMLAALESDWDSKKKIQCSGSYRCGRRVFHCWKDTGHGPLNMIDALAQSCNIYCYSVASHINIEKLYSIAKIFGLGEKTNIELDYENIGILPDNNWKMMRYKVPWQTGDSLNMSIGQGFLEANPLQILIMMSRIATGKKIKPNILYDQISNNDFDEINGVSVNNLNIVRQGIINVINSDSGLYKHHQSNLIDFAGKSGTAQVISKRMNRQQMEEQKKLNKNVIAHGLFAGYAPYNNPKFSVIAVVDNAFSSSAALPLAKKALIKTMEIFNK